jgi:hypothetical protein
LTVNVEGNKSLREIETETEREREREKWEEEEDRCAL